ncbi:MAG: MBL fold metallo-hydrolase [Candidatus Thorarchaeota archaeon]
MLFSFKDPYLSNVYVVIGNERIFVLDTSLGSDPMLLVKQQLKDEGYGNRPVVEFNSHGDYDHHWGNAVFEDSMLIGHLYTRARILEEGEEALRKYKGHMRGDVTIRAPSTVFMKRLEFPEEGLSFFHTPGHTIDSASCYDEIDKILFVGDNVESPIPYIYDTNLSQYTKTFESYREFDWEVMIASHDPPLHDDSLLEKNIEYVSSLQKWSIDLSELTEEELHVHVHNIKFLKENIDKTNLSSAAKLHIAEMKKLKHQG